MKNIKYIMVTLCVIILGLTTLSAQNQSAAVAGTLPGKGITLSVILPEQEDPFPSGAKSYLSNKLIQSAIVNGIGASEDFGRFFITANIAMATKDIVPGPPTQVAQNMEITLFIADYFDQKIFASTNLSLKGVGTNDTKSYINAIKNLNPRDSRITEFIEKGKDKIIEYYKAQCDNIIKKANSLAYQKQYEEAIYLLTSIPDAAGDCYDRALESTRSIYQMYVDYLCDVNLAKAKAAWAAEQNSVGAQKAGVFMSQIYPDAKCYGDGQNLYREIKGKVLDDWKFEMKKWQDGVDLESQRIEALRAVGVAYGNGQQPTSYVLGWCK